MRKKSGVEKKSREIDYTFECVEESMFVGLRV